MFLPELLKLLHMLAIWCIAIFKNSKHKCFTFRLFFMSLRVRTSMFAFGTRFRKTELHRLNVLF